MTGKATGLDQEFIYYLQNRIQDLEIQVRSEDPDKEENDNSNGGGSQPPLCTNPYCNCPCQRGHRRRHHPPAASNTVNGMLHWRMSNTVCHVGALLG
ncbi:hypothetical protein C2845_PM11G28780 [Panicum miliaceum]|uniref:Uncharacterized protein n=1 Tax=Panicum miliaceum TaxID=4540 RepID=A0A3L6RQJ0_PANMI|nr:hypothetical protein C2845_PM11G28780 [Panicum miliaceum]